MILILEVRFWIYELVGRWLLDIGYSLLDISALPETECM